MDGTERTTANSRAHRSAEGVVERCEAVSICQSIPSVEKGIENTDEMFFDFETAK